MNIYLDMDGVLCDSLDLWEEWIRDKFDLDFDCSHYWSDARDRYGSGTFKFWHIGSDVYDRTQPFKYTKEFVASLIEDGHNVSIVTSTFPGMDFIKNQWFRKHLPMITNSIICVNGKKNHYTRDGILIDDGFHNIADHVSHNNCAGILYNHNDKYPHVSMFKKNCDGKMIKYCISYNQLLLEIKKIEMYGL